MPPSTGKGGPPPRRGRIADWSVCALSVLCSCAVGKTLAGDVEHQRIRRPDNELAFTRERRRHIVAEREALQTRARAAEQWAPAAAERTVGQGQSGVRRVQRQVIQCMERTVIQATETLASPCVGAPWTWSSSSVRAGSERRALLEPRRSRCATDAHAAPLCVPVVVASAATTVGVGRARSEARETVSVIRRRGATGPLGAASPVGET